MLGLVLGTLLIVFRRRVVEGALRPGRLPLGAGDPESYRRGGRWLAIGVGLLFIASDLIEWFNPWRP